MKRTSPQSNASSCGLPLLVLLGWLAGTVPTPAQTTSFSYQGWAAFQGNPASGNVDVTFGLFDAATAGNQIGSTITNLNVAVSNGLFTVTLDFGANAFPGADRWLELGLRTNGSSDAFATLSPRQQLTPAPYAVTATTASGGWPTTWAGSAITGAVAQAAHATSADNATTATTATTASGGWPTTWAGSAITSAVAETAHATNADNATAATMATTATTASGGWPTTWAGSAITSAVAQAVHATSADNVTGNIADSQLSANVPLLNGNNTVSGPNTFNGVVKNVISGVEFYMVPRGGIIIWSGSAASIPSGWGLCDGTQGTPNLKDRFVVNAGNTYAVAAIGGATSHTHDTAIGSPTTSAAGAHTHTTTSSTTGSESSHTHGAGTFATGTGTTGNESSHTHGGGTLQFGRQVDFGASGSGTVGPWVINVTSGTSGSPKFNALWAGATGAGSAHSHSLPALSVGGTSAAASAHAHSIPSLSTDSQGSHSHTVTIGTITSTSSGSLPPYYALCYIMKL